MTTITDLTPAQRITVLKHAIAGRDTAFITTVTRLSREQVRQVLQSHGYPDVPKMEWAIDVLDKQAEGDLVTTKPLATGQVVLEKIPAATLAPPTGPRPTPAPQPLTKPDEIRVLLNAAKGHPSKRIQNAANKVFDDLDRLRTLIKTDEEKHAAERRAKAVREAEKRRREQEREQALAEVRAAEEALRAARAKLRGHKNHPGGNGKAETLTSPSNESRRPGGMAAAASGQLAKVRGGGLATNIDLERLGVTSKQIRVWAHEHDVECPNSGRLPSRVLAAYEQANTQDGAA